MILPIYAYGQPVLRKVANDIEPDEFKIDELVQNLFETMYNASGVGLAGPQVGLAKRIFVVDTQQSLEDNEKENGIKKVFINAQILSEEGEPWSYEEGCLSIPDIRGDVERLPILKIRYQDENFSWHEDVFEGINARVIQHEYDHIDGILFTDLLKPIKKRRIAKKLQNIKKGKSKADYPLKFASVSRR